MRPPAGMKIERHSEADPVGGGVGFKVTATEITHACPPEGSGVMPCCGLTPFEAPVWHRLTIDGLVTCPGAVS